MIRSAEIRATVKQIDGYKAAVNAFRGKYNGLPADIDCNKAQAWGLPIDPFRGPPNCQNDTNYGFRENGYIDGHNGGEMVMFWRQLAAAGMVEGAFLAPSPGPGCADNDRACFDGLYPSSNTTPTQRVWAVPMTSWYGRIANAFKFIDSSCTTSGNFNCYTNSTNTIARSMTTQMAFDMDSKIDDGLPSSGIMVHTDENGYMRPAGNNTNCVTAGLTYDFSYTLPACSPTINMQ